MRKAHSPRLSRAIVTMKADASPTGRVPESGRARSAHLAALPCTAYAGSWEVELRGLKDLSRNPLWWSDQTFRIFGYEPGSVQITHELFEKGVVPEDRARVWAEVHAALH